MLALKKKREVEKKEKEEAAKHEAAGPAAPAAAGQVSLFGIGGEKRTKKMQGTKKSPGEIRIQKGKFSIQMVFKISVKFMRVSLICSKPVIVLQTLANSMVAR